MWIIIYHNWPRTSLLDNPKLVFMRENKKSALKLSARFIRKETLRMIQEAHSLA